MGFFSKIFGGLTRTRENVGTKVDELVANMPLADDDFYEELTDILIMAAAVADYRPAQVADNKIKKKDEDLSIPLARTDDILGSLAPRKTTQFVCGFSMETQDMIENSRKKLEKKHLDMIAANNLKVEGAGFGVDTNVLTLITADETRQLPLMSKDEAADALLDAILKEWAGR